MIPDTSAQDRPLSTTPRPAWRRWLWPAAGAMAALALLGWVVAGWGAGSRSYDASRIRIAQVARGDLVRDISADGKVITANSPTLYAIAGGTVTLKVVAGDVVEKDRELAVIDSPELRSKLVQEESTLASMEAEASRAQLDAQIARLNARKALDQARIDHTAAQRDLERYERAHAGGAVSNNELARAQDELKKADVGLQAAQSDAGLQAQGAVLDARNKRLLADRQQAVVAELRRQVEALTLRAPFDGQVGQVQIAQGTNVTINAPILSVVDLREFEVEIRVPESFARDLAIGVPAQVTSQGRQYPAKVSAVSPEVVDGEVNARLRFDQGRQPPGLRQNQRLSTRIVLDTRKDVLMVERGPFVEQDGGHWAWVVDGRSAQRRPIQTGVSSLGYVEIVSGLREGERIVVSGADQFGDAQRVAIN
ncbi:efflux transporter periplasmic adaptor subunit [Pseudoxanthomonas broegbernensis]|uniref:Efflux transporter periplasmic adaptor subunit n=1 Tax=Pseudoxanthomonas broegbernensis TaxID=83619 RepID=A0A7V8K739_9GAMM|nr:efflux RND transporter periplasmic adaptor subunit [Pseudoxanthomonas broegbernensis]KAF1686658.1 efflux transporter periplasmic adaptor subunit [Pseudoxanthomonas broegbernensis]MBB6063584.1 HlyD family secretion protein [Pseudoxanthomonas broegbernensis]